MDEIDPKTACCVIAVAPTTEEAFDKAIEEFQEKVEEEREKYYFNALATEIDVVEEAYNKVIVVHLWFERCPRW